MRIGLPNHIATAALAAAFALIAKDLTMPLLVVSTLGLFDRLVGEPVLRQEKR